MKKALLISLLLFSLATTSNSQSITDRERDGLKGPVQAVSVRKTTTLDENGVRTETPLQLSHVTKYDKAGSRTELALHDSCGTLTRRIVYTYELETGRRSGMITYDSNNAMVRKVVDVYGKNGLEKNRTIETFNEDGTVYRKTEVTFDSLGVMTEVAEYRPDGSLIKKERAPFKEPEPDSTRVAPTPETEGPRLVSSGSRRGEYSDPDSYGNWTSGITSSRRYSSGKNTKTREVVYREFTYY